MNRDAPGAPSRTVADVDRVIARGLADKTYLAAACVASARSQMFHGAAYGHLAPPPPVRRLDMSAVFDLGDLSKPLGAGLMALWLVARNRLELRTPVSRILKEFGYPPFTQITVDMLLDHTSGLPADANLVETLLTHDKSLHPNEQLVGTRKAQPLMRQALAATELAAPPGTQVIYSQLGFLLLGWVLEAVAGRPIDAFLHQEIFKPLGLENDVFFLPLDAKKTPTAPPVVVTDTCPWRKKLLQGEVFDKNAWALGGVAGHAGLFGSARGVWQLAQALLSAHRGQKSMFHTGTVARFWTRSKRLTSTYTLGWDTPTVLSSAAGKRLSRTAVGQIGSTGGALWIDYGHETIGVLLTNAVGPTSPKTAVHRVRTRVYDLIAAHAALGPASDDIGAVWQRLVSDAERRNK